MEERKKAATRRLPAVGTGDQPYHPSHRSTASGRSPYPTRPADVSYTEQVLSEEEGEVGEVEEEVAVDQRKVVAGRKKMARRSEEVDLASLMKMMIDRDEKWRERDEKRRQDSEDRKREEEAAREKKREEDEAKRQKERDVDLRALEERLRREEEHRQKRRDEEYARCRDEDDRRRRDELQWRRDEEDRRKTRREEEDKAREKKELLQEKLKGLGVYKDGNDLGAYLEKFERIMREGELEDKFWAERPDPRLPERLCVRVAQLRDDGSVYAEVKGVLLKAAGETAITYGNHLFDATRRLRE